MHFIDDDTTEGDLYEGEEHLLEEVPRLGWACFFRAAKHGLGRADRCHRDSYEIYNIIDGILTIRIDGHICQARAGEVLMVRPGEHFSGLGTKCVVEPCSIRWLQLCMEKFKPPVSVAREDRRVVRDELAAIKSRSFRISEETANSLKCLIDEHRRHLDHYILVARSSLYTFVAGLIRDHRRAAGRYALRPRRQGSWVQDVLDWIAKQPEGEISLREMADVSGISLSRFYQAFRREFGITPANYLMRRRVSKAKKHLAEGKLSITEIAMRLDFSSSQHFASMFKRYTAMTPSMYRRQHR